jgi:phospho-N-acetylmuramoyl-pentapeptide-transferase
LIYHLLYPLHESISYFNVFRYITFRTIYAAITALAICFVFGPWLIRKLESLQIGQNIREDGPGTHLAKSGTPTMGGIMIIFSVVISTLLWANLTNDFVWMLILVTVGFGIIGFFDDFNKLTKQNSKGISKRTRLFFEIAIALFIGIALYLKPNFSEAITIPFFKTMLPDLGWGYVLFTVFVIVGAANAVNLTDGLDGLALGPALICFITYLLFAYFAGNARISGYLQIPYVPGTGELAIFCGAMVGACLGFLWYNTYPAQIFMGDVGSLSLGRGPGHAGPRDETGTAACHRGRDFRAGDRFGHLPGGLVQGFERQAHLSHGPHPPSLRAEGVGGAEGDRAVLDHLDHPGPRGHQYTEAEVTEDIGTHE